MSKAEPNVQRTSIQPFGVCQSAHPDSVEVTVYQHGGLAVVREKRGVDLIAGPNQVYLEGLPTQYQLNSLTVLDYEGEGELKLGPVSYRAANLDKQRILSASVGKRVTVKEILNNGRVSNINGILRAALGNELAVERTDNKRLILVPAGQVELDEGLPAGLSSTPSLMMLPTATSAGKYGLNLLYEAGGLQWTARYSAFYDEKANKLSRLEASVAITNQSGARFLNALVKLLASANYGQPHAYAEGMVMAAAAPMGGGMRKQALRHYDAPVETVGEAKMYSLPERVTIADGETQQVTLFLAREVPVKREYFLTAGGYDNEPGQDAQKLPVYVRLRLKNDKDSNLGAALPAGEVSILQPDASGSPQKTFTASLSATAEGEKFKLEYGPSADIKAERVLVSAVETEEGEESSEPEAPQFPIKPLGGPGMPGDRARDIARDVVTAPKQHRQTRDEDEGPARYREEERQLTVHNYKGEAVEVLVSEYVPENAEFLNQPEGYTIAQEPTGATLRVKVPAKGKTTLTYRLRWQLS